MSSHAITRAKVAYLLAAKKFVYSEVENNYESLLPSITETRVTYEIRRSDKPEEYLGLRVFARLERQLMRGGVKPLPGISLMWHNERIRGLSWRIRHPVSQNGVVIDSIKGWHEHQWTDAKRSPISVNDIIGSRRDFWSLVRWCLSRWNIELPRELRDVGLDL